MKKFFERHIYLGRMTDRTGDEVIGNANERIEVRPEALRWFCGMHDMEATFICRAL